MNEAENVDINESLGLTPEPQEPQENNEPEEQEAPEYSEDELKAKDGGWVPKDEFKGPEDNWKSAKSFNEFGDQQAKIRNLSSQIKKHSSAMSDLNKFHHGQLEMQAEQLKSEFNNAVEDGNVDKANEIAGKQANVAAQQSNIAVEPAQTDDQALKDQWELDNPYCFEPDNPKARAANVAFNIAQRQGKNMSEALDFVNEQVADKFPEKRVNDNRFAASSVANGAGAPRGSREPKITMRDASPQELQMFNTLFKGDEKKFLAALVNSRK